MSQETPPRENSQNQDAGGQGISLPPPVSSDSRPARSLPAPVRSAERPLRLRRPRQPDRVQEVAETTSAQPQEASSEASPQGTSLLGSSPIAKNQPQVQPRRRPPRARGPVTNGLGEISSAPATSEGVSSTPVSELPATITSSSDTSSAEAQRERRRRRRFKARSEGESGSAHEVVEYSTDAQLADAMDVGARGKRRFNQRVPLERNGRPVGRYLMAVQVRGGVNQIAILEGRTLIEHYVSKEADDQYSIDGNIYLGRVANVLPGMEAAFIDIGTSKNAVIYRGDVRFDRDDLESGDRSVRIEHLLRPKQTVVCQVVKNPIGAKGARLTQEVSLPGRFVVLIPNSESYGISKRLPEEERRRLRKILDEVKPSGFGVIVRTAAEGASPEELKRDLERLTEMWKKIEEGARFAHAPSLLYREPQVALRVIREEFNRNYRNVVIDDKALYEEVVNYVSAISPELADRVEFYDRETQSIPIFEAHHVHEQLHKALARKVWLPSGGSIVIDRAEALTVIDVNTAKNVGTVSLEETIHKNNLEAVEEIAHQLRLRDIGGIIVIDFIDMLVRENREDVMRAFRAALARDKTRSHVYDMSPLGLVEMTRQRVSEGLVEAFSESCPACGGRGLIFDQVLL